MLYTCSRCSVNLIFERERIKFVAFFSEKVRRKVNKMRNAIPTVKRWVEAVNLAVTKVAQACPACSGCQAVAETRTVSVAHPDHVYHFRLPASISTSSELGLTARSFIPRNVKRITGGVRGSSVCAARSSALVSLFSLSRKYVSLFNDGDPPGRWDIHAGDVVRFRKRDLHYFAGAAPREHRNTTANLRGTAITSLDVSRNVIGSWRNCTGAAINDATRLFPLIYRRTFFDNNSRSHAHVRPDVLFKKLKSINPLGRYRFPVHNCILHSETCAFPFFLITLFYVLP